MVNAEADLNLFDLIGMEWLAPEVQQIAAQLGRSKAVELSTADIHEFQHVGVKIITHKSAPLNEVAEIYIRPPSVTPISASSLLPYGLALGQSQAEIKSLLGEAYDSQLAFTFLPISLPSLHMTPERSDGWDIYLSNQLPLRYLSKQSGGFLLRIRYPLHLQNRHEIKDEHDKTLTNIRVASSIHLADEITLKKWNGVLPERSGMDTPEKLAQHAQGNSGLKALFQQAWKLYQGDANE